MPDLVDTGSEQSPGPQGHTAEGRQGHHWLPTPPLEAELDAGHRQGRTVQSGRRQTPSPAARSGKVAWSPHTPWGQLSPQDPVPQPESPGEHLGARCRDPRDELPWFMELTLALGIPCPTGRRHRGLRENGIQARDCQLQTPGPFLCHLLQDLAAPGTEWPLGSGGEQGWSLGSGGKEPRS